MCVFSHESVGLPQGNEPVESVVVVTQKVGVRCRLLETLVRNNGNIGCGDVGPILFNLNELFYGADEEHKNGGC